VQKPFCRRLFSLVRQGTNESRKFGQLPAERCHFVVQTFQFGFLLLAVIFVIVTILVRLSVAAWRGRRRLSPGTRRTTTHQEPHGRGGRAAEIVMDVDVHCDRVRRTIVCVLPARVKATRVRSARTGTGVTESTGIIIAGARTRPRRRIEAMRWIPWLWVEALRLLGTGRISGPCRRLLWAKSGPAESGWAAESATRASIARPSIIGSAVPIAAVFASGSPVPWAPLYPPRTIHVAVIFVAIVIERGDFHCDVAGYSTPQAPGRRSVVGRMKGRPQNLVQ
jgi:hypothetical protein